MDTKMKKFQVILSNDVSVNGQILTPYFKERPCDYFTFEVNG